VLLQTRLFGVSALSEGEGMPADARMQEEAPGYGAADHNKRWECGTAIAATKENIDAANDKSWGMSL
jgi:hypothetical protein